ncbi:MAG: VWA domain-containing protein [Acidimicrobiia bacterium]|nr:VWA domain-containing protein [Acidimicrobiia bacterium]
MLLDVLTGFIQELRSAGVPVSMVEAIDATDGLRHTDLADREAFKATLGATLVKNVRHLDAFETAFEVFFAHHRPELETGGDSSSQDKLQQPAGHEGRPGGGGDGDLDELLEALFQALLSENLSALRALVRQAVDDLAGIEPGRPVGGTYYLYRTLRRLGVDGLLDRLLESSAEAGRSDLEERLIREEYEERIEQLREEIRDEIRRRLVADRGREAVAKTLRKPLLEDVDLMHASRADLAQLEQVINPLTRKLAARLAHKRRLRRSGRLDFRRTVRRSLSTGGVPIEPQFRAPHPIKPEIFLLCDISGSMATFARFTLQFMYAMSSQFSKVRSFAFIDALDEITSFLEVGSDFPHALDRISSEAEVVWIDGHSDYGRSLDQFWARFGAHLTRRSTVIITGDARNNYRDLNSEVVSEMLAVSRAVYWLNPEPEAYWDTGDSVMNTYAKHCTGAYEVRNLRQLEAFVEEIALPPIGRVARPMPHEPGPGRFWRR